MILALDTYYQNDKAKTVCIRFHHWTDDQPADVLTEELDSVEEYQPGAFYRRELPCILSILKKTDVQDTEAIIIDGYVLLDDTGKHGLGGYLYEALNRKIPVIGVAKTNFANNTLHKKEVYRAVVSDRFTLQHSVYHLKQPVTIYVPCTVLTEFLRY